jgi:hypothetical protein
MRREGGRDNNRVFRWIVSKLRPANRRRRHVDRFRHVHGLPAEVGSRPTTDMQMSDAEEIMKVLNFIHSANDNGTVH